MRLSRSKSIRLAIHGSIEPIMATHSGRRQHHVYMRTHHRHCHLLESTVLFMYGDG